jgi:hypothetical protein
MFIAYRLLVGKHKGKRLLERTRHKWENNIRMDLKEICLEDVDCIHLTGQGPKNKATNHQVPYNRIRSLGPKDVFFFACTHE